VIVFALKDLFIVEGLKGKGAIRRESGLLNGHIS